MMKNGFLKQALKSIQFRKNKKKTKNKFNSVRKNKQYL